jgi:hypothetical protein
MKKLLNSLLIRMFVVGALLMSCTFAVAADPEGKKYENADPVFSIMTPSGWDSADMMEGDYIGVQTGQYKLPSLYVSKAKYHTDNVTLKSLSQGASEVLKAKYQATNIEILYAKEITLKDGTPAFEAEIKWQHPQVLLYSTHVWPKKGNVGIVAIMTDMDAVSASLKAYLYTLSVK